MERTDCESCQTSIDDAALNLVSGLSNILDAAVASVDQLATKTAAAWNETVAERETEDAEDAAPQQETVKAKVVHLVVSREQACLCSLSDVVFQTVRFSVFSYKTLSFLHLGECAIHSDPAPWLSQIPQDGYQKNNKYIVSKGL